MTVGFDVFVQLVIAAITTCPWSTVNVSPSRSTVTAARGRSATSPPPCRGRWAGGSGAPMPLAAAPADGGSLAGNDWADAASGLAGRTCNGSWSNPPGRRAGGIDEGRASRKAALPSASDTRSCGREGPAIDGSTVDKSSCSVSRERRSRRRVVPQALLLRVGLDEVDQLGGPSGEPQVAQRLGVDREDGHRRAVLR